MTKKQIPFNQQFSEWVTSHPWIKLISLVLSILVWFYVKTELKRF